MKLTNNLKNNWYVIKLSFLSAPGYMVYYIFETIKLQCLTFLEGTFGIYYVLSNVEKGGDFNQILRFACLLVCLWILSYASSAVFNNIIKIKGMAKINQELKNRIFDKAKNVDLAYYDDPKWYDEFILSTSESQNIVEKSQKILKAFLEGVVGLFTCGTFFVTLDKISFLFVLVSFLLNYFFGFLLNKLNFNRKVTMNIYERKRNYIHRLFYLVDYAKEIRLNADVTKIFEKEFDNTNEKMFMYEKNISGKKRLLTFLAGFVPNSFLMDFAYILYLAYKAMVMHSISYSAVVVLFDSSYRLERTFRQFSEILPGLNENGKFIEKIKTFLQKENNIHNNGNLSMPKTTKDLELKNVSFAYEEGKNVINNVSFTLRANEKIAIVGSNGAGKSTLIKLILRLYDPTEGEILLDGVNIINYPIDEYRKYICTIYQDFNLYSAMLKENVALDCEDNISDSKVREALNRSGFGEKLESFSKGVETPILSEFEEEGKELSGGEMQKIAVSRAFYSDSNIIILDEPSSALDPLAEYELNCSIFNSPEKRSVIFISHRLSTTRFADHVILLTKGEIEEQGTHEELLNLQGKYYELWCSQSKCYLV